MNAMRQDAQKPVRKFCAHKTAKNAKTHPEKPEKGETGCVLGAGEGCSRYGRVGNPEIRTKMHQIAMQHMQKGNRRKPSVFAGFLFTCVAWFWGSFWFGLRVFSSGLTRSQPFPSPPAPKTHPVSPFLAQTGCVSLVLSSFDLQNFRLCFCASCRIAFTD